MLLMPPKEKQRREREEHEKRQNQIMQGLLNEHDTEMQTSDNVTINDCIESPIKNFKICGKEIKQEVREGYNQVDESQISAYQNIDTIENGIITSSNLTNSGIVNFTVNINNIDVEKGDCYISCDVRLKSGTCERLNTLQALRSLNISELISAGVVSDTNITNQFKRFTRKYTFGNSNEDKINRFLIQATNCENAVFEVKNIQISKENNKYEKYGQSPSKDFSSNLNYVEGNQRVEHVNENLLDFIDLSYNVISQDDVIQNEDKSIIINYNTTSSGADIRKIYDKPLKVKKGKYIFYFGNNSANMFNVELNLNPFGKGTYKLIKRLATGTEKVEVTFEEDFDIYNYCVHLSPNKGFKDFIIKPMIFAYKENIEYISNQSETINLTNLPDLYSENDYIYYNKDSKKYFVHNKYNRKIADGEELLIETKTGSTNNNQYYFNNINNIKVVDNNGEIPNIYSNLFLKTSTNDLYTGRVQEGISITTNGKITIAFGVDSEINTVTKANQFLQKNIVEIVYPLEKSTDTPLTDSVLIKQLDKLRKIFTCKGANHFIVTSENGQSANLEVTAYKDTFKIMQKEIDNLKALVLENTVES